MGCGSDTWDSHQRSSGGSDHAVDALISLEPLAEMVLSLRRGVGGAEKARAHRRRADRKRRVPSDGCLGDMVCQGLEQAHNEARRRNEGLMSGPETLCDGSSTTPYDQ